MNTHTHEGEGHIDEHTHTHTHTHEGEGHIDEVTHVYIIICPQTNFRLYTILDTRTHTHSQHILGMELHDRTLCVQPLVVGHCRHLHSHTTQCTH